jgi:hypothetical protein
MHHTGDDRRNPFGEKFFKSLWQLCNLMHSWMFGKIHPTALLKMVDKSLIDETYSLMKISWLELRVEVDSMAQS